MTITGIPAHSNAVIGPSLVCANSTATYTMPGVPGVSTYTWSITGGATLIGQTLTSTATSATFNFGPTWTSGTVTISVSNACSSLKERLQRFYTKSAGLDFRSGNSTLRTKQCNLFNCCSAGS
ncbi:MAG: hypothetical protein IPN61_02140, partial [Bacteroidetes bacterium]|nr:hypothetical protein [Bacteroidota bacterium]